MIYHHLLLVPQTGAQVTEEWGFSLVMNSLLFCSYSFLWVCTCLAVPVSSSKPGSVTWQLIIQYLHHYTISGLKNLQSILNLKTVCPRKRTSTKPVGIDRAGINLSTKIMRCDHKSSIKTWLLTALWPQKEHQQRQKSSKLLHRAPTPSTNVIRLQFASFSASRWVKRG